jgi:[histone H3]-lysine9 N-trimethyltransferase EHMT
VKGVPIAVSIVASKGYPDRLTSTDELIYTGSGGNISNKKQVKNQKLERGNLALKNCLKSKSPVRVIHGFKCTHSGEASQSNVMTTSMSIYDGLYSVIDFWKELPKGFVVFKYKLERIPGQAELTLHAVNATRKSKVEGGLCLSDISQGSEMIPILVINTIDDISLVSFKYITKVIYPSWYQKQSSKGCDCTKGCKYSAQCACTLKNEGQIPFNLDGAIMEVKDLVFECGPSCRYGCAKFLTNTNSW